MVLPDSKEGAGTWIAIKTERMPNGWLAVTYSFASGITYVATVNPGTDAARAIQLTGDALAHLYGTQGYL